MLSKADLIACERELCRRSLAEFAKLAWRVLEPAAELKWGWALDAICEHLEAVTDGRITRLLINVPPGCMKSLLTGVIWPAWEWGPRGMPWKRYVGTAHEEQLAIRDSRRCRDLIKSDWYQALWPVELAADLDGKREFGNTAKGVRQARSFTSMTGVRGDCLLAGAMVETEDGIKAIEDIVASSYSGNVLSYDDDSKQLVYRPVEAVARRSSSDFYRVHFADGSVVECTGDHRIYTSRGYREARFLSAGDTCLRLLRGNSDTNSCGHEEAQKERLQTRKLFEKVQPDADQHCGREDGAVLHCVRSKNSQKQAPVFGCLQIKSQKTKRHQKTQADGNVCLFGVQKTDTDQVIGLCQQVLFESLQGRSSRIGNARSKQSWMAQRCVSNALRQGSKTSLCACSKDCSRGGQHEMRGMQCDASVALPSYRSQFDEQYVAKLGDTLPNMSHETSRHGTIKVENVSVSLVERVCKSTDVYDIQVAQTRCFFANGVLVHNCVILDDPISAYAANSAAALEAAKVAFLETLPTRVNNDKSAIVVIMQRLNEADVSGVILSMGLPYVHLCIPMRYEPARSCTTEIGWEDPRSQPGELMFPERFSEAAVRQLELALGTYGTAGQLQQAPAPRGGGIIKTEWYRYWTSLPAVEWRVITADTAQKTGESNDYSVLQCWGRSTVGQAVLLDQLRGKWESPELITHARAFWSKHRGCRAMYVEDKVSGTGLIQTLRREGIAVIPVPRNKDKLSRGHDSAPFIESGNVLLPRDAPWLSDFLAESESFPAGAHDDQLDPMFDAIKLVQELRADNKKTCSPIPIINSW